MGTPENDIPLGYQGNYSVVVLATGPTYQTRIYPTQKFDTEAPALGDYDIRIDGVCEAAGDLISRYVRSKVELARINRQELIQLLQRDIN